jgi:hypothetical protein
VCFFVPADRVKSLYFISCFVALPALAANWQSTVSKDPPGNFPSPPPLEAQYHFGWGGFTAATAEARFLKPTPERFQLEGAGRTVHFARLLWKFDVDYRSMADAATLRPIEANQVETYRSKKLTTHLVFTAAAVHRTRTETPPAGPNKAREFQFQNLFDLHSALLYLRSQPLTDGSVYRIVVYPGTAAYFATFTVTRHEKISVHAGTFAAIKIDLRLQKIGKDLELEPHKKFRRASVWVSDDNLRIPLRAEAQIFIGTVFAELQSFRIQPQKG